jgi:hypothetical protein
MLNCITQYSLLSKHSPRSKGKGKANPVTGPGGPIGRVEVKLNSFLTSALEEGVWSASRLGRFYPRERPGTHCTGGWAPEPVWIGAENLGPPGFDPRTFQPVASRYTDYAIPAPIDPGVADENLGERTYKDSFLLV